MAHSVRRIIIIIRRTFTFTVSKITVILYIRRNRRRDVYKRQEWEESIKAADCSDEIQVYPLVLYLSSARLWNENRTGAVSYTHLDVYKRQPARCLNRTEFQ